MGESLTLNCGRENMRVARLSNVFGRHFDTPNFLDSIVRDAVSTRRIVLRSHPQTTKDYVFIDDVVAALTEIALCGRQRLYNIASGSAIAHRQILEIVRQQTGCEMSAEPHGGPVPSPIISIERVRRELGFSPRPVLPCLTAMLERFASVRCPA